MATSANKLQALQVGGRTIAESGKFRPRLGKQPSGKLRSGGWGRASADQASSVWSIQEINVGSVQDANASMSTSSCTH
eukprot:3940247-Rhodomonas_salina.2